MLVKICRQGSSDFEWRYSHQPSSPNRLMYADFHNDFLRGEKGRCLRLVRNKASKSKRRSMSISSSSLDTPFPINANTCAYHANTIPVTENFEINNTSTAFDLDSKSAITLHFPISGKAGVSADSPHITSSNFEAVSKSERRRRIQSNVRQINQQSPGSISSIIPSQDDDRYETVVLSTLDPVFDYQEMAESCSMMLGGDTLRHGTHEYDGGHKSATLDDSFKEDGLPYDEFIIVVGSAFQPRTIEEMTRELYENQVQSNKFFIGTMW